MTFSILIDLDNTLLRNDSDKFIQAYLKKIGRHLTGWPTEKVISELLAGTQRMIAKDTPAETLEQVFDRAFYPGLGVEKEVLRDRIDSFYREVFPELRELTHPDPDAQRLIEYLFQKKHSIVIATNPLYPRTAILQRLAWAGLPVERYPFNLIGSYETFHFSKPNPAFLAEALARLGWVDQPAIMIGDNLQEDIVPATKLGLPAFWLNTTSALPEGLHPLTAQGKLTEIIPWLEKIENEFSEAQVSTPFQINALLKSTPAAFEALTSNLSDNQWRGRPNENEWAANEIACHLRDADAEVNLPRIKMISAGENPFLPGIVTDVWASERGYINQNGPAALATFVAVRSELVNLLGSFNAEGWKMPARHAIFGPTQLLELAGFITTHDRTHIHQLYDTINRHKTGDKLEFS